MTAAPLSAVRSSWSRVRPFTPLHTSVIGVISAKYTGDNTDLARAGHAALGTYRLPDTYFFNPTSLSTLPPGKVLAFSTDEQISANDYGTFNRITMRYTRSHRRTSLVS